MHRNCNQHRMKFLIMYEYRVSNETESDTNCVGGADQKILPLSLTCRMENRKKMLSTELSYICTPLLIILICVQYILIECWSLKQATSGVRDYDNLCSTGHTAPGVVAGEHQEIASYRT